MRSTAVQIYMGDDQLLESGARLSFVVVVFKWKGGGVRLRATGGDSSIMLNFF